MKPPRDYVRRDIETCLLQVLTLSNDLTAITELDDLLHRISSVAQELTATESAGILLYEAASHQLFFVTATTFADVIVNVPVPIDHSIAGACFVSGEAIIVPDVSRDPRYYRGIDEMTGIKTRSLLAVPMQYQERRVGVLEVENKRDDTPFNADDVAILTALAAHAAIAIENARLVQALITEQERLEGEVAARTKELRARNARLRQEIEERELAQATIVEQQRALAALEERERLGRELHDGLGQAMGYISLEAQTAQLWLEQNQLSSVRASLERLALVAQDAHTDVRNSILGLRTTTFHESNLCDALQSYLRQFSRTTDIAVTLSCPPDIATPTLAPVVEEQVLRIVQEALANVRKHAQASKVEVIVSITSERLQIIVSDDGVGFDTNRQLLELSGHFGLSIMSERAEQVGGRLEVRSSRGSGTQVLLSVPRAEPATDASEPVDLTMLQKLRILLVDDHPLFLDGLRNLLLARGLAVVGVARDGLQAQEQARLLRPDVIVMDMHMPHCDGLEATRAIKAELPDTKIVILTVAEDDATLFEAIKSGASGYLLKSLEANTFCSLLTGLMRGEAALAPGMAEKLLIEFARSAATPTRDQPETDPLTPRQWQVLQLVAQGQTYKEVGATLYLSEKTIKYHMGQILEKLHLKNRAQAIAYLKEREM